MSQRWTNEMMARALKDPVLNDEEMYSLEYTPTKVEVGHPLLNFPVGLRLWARVIPDLAWSRDHMGHAERTQHTIDEFTEFEARSIELKHTPITIEHVVYRSEGGVAHKTTLEGLPRSIGRVEEEWMVEDRDGSVHKDVVFDVRETNDFLMGLAYRYLRDEITTSVSLSHLYLPLKSVGRRIKLPTELSICRTPRRDGANIYRVEVLGEGAQRFWMEREGEPLVETVYVN